ncbi:MAG: hypothetical protein ACREUQ_00790 [Burkholderiales bacterium]
MSDAKPWWESRGMWGSIVAASAGVAGVLGYSISDVDQVALADLGLAAAGAIGGLVALIGRLYATTRISR